jgi:hypothetical protein
MESTLRKLRIHTIKGQLALCELVCRSLAIEYENENLTAVQKEAIINRWSATTKQRHELQLELEEQEREQNT